MPNSTVSPSTQTQAHHPTPAQSWDLIELSPMFDIRDLVAVIKRRLPWLIILPVLGAIVAAVYLIFFATPYYKSAALVFIDPKFDRILQVENVNSVASDLDSLNSLERAMTSNSMVLRVIDRLNLRKELDFLPKSLHKKIKKGKTISDSELLNEITTGKRISCALIRPTRLLELSVIDKDPERARLIASTFVTEFESFLGEQKMKEASNSEAALRTRADSAYERALHAEKQLEMFRAANPGLTVEQDHNLFAERLSRYGEELNQVSSKVLDLQSKVETVAQIDPNTYPIQVIKIGGFDTAEHVSDLMTQRLNAKSELAVAQSVYTDTHPRYQEASRRHLEIEAQLRQLAIDLKTSISADFVAARANETLLHERVTFLQKELSSVKSASSEFRAIQQKVETEWRVHEALQQRIGETSLLTDKSTSITTEMSKPIAAHKPAKPSKPLGTLLGGLLGGLIAIGLVVFDLFKDSPFVDRKQLESSLNLNVLAETPFMNDPNQDRQLMLSQMSQILLSPQHRQSKIIHVTSVEPSTSGHHVAAALGYASAYYGNPTLTISMEPGTDPNSLVSFTPQKSHHDNLYSLSIPASFLLAPENVWQMLNPHCQHFSRIILESSCLAQESQVPTMISSFSETTLLMVRNGIDYRKKIESVVNDLRQDTKGQVSVVLEG